MNMIRGRWLEVNCWTVPKRFSTRLGAEMLSVKPVENRGPSEQRCGRATSVCRKVATRINETPTSAIGLSNAAPHANMLVGNVAPVSVRTGDEEVKTRGIVSDCMVRAVVCGAEWNATVDPCSNAIAVASDRQQTATVDANCDIGATSPSCSYQFGQLPIPYPRGD